jgi:hypothetical protein
MYHGVAGRDDVVTVTWPAVAGYHHAAAVRADDDLGVDAAAVVLADGGDRLVVHRGQGAVDDPRVVGGVGGGSQCAGQHRHQVMDDPVNRGLAGVKQRGQPAGGQIRPQVNEHQQHPHRQRQAPGPSGRRRYAVTGQCADGADLTDC